jgi:hypothetical protein
MAQSGTETVEGLDTLPSNRPRKEEVFERNDFGVTVVVARVGDEGYGLGQVLTRERWVTGGIETSAE